VGEVAKRGDKLTNLTVSYIKLYQFEIVFSFFSLPILGCHDLLISLYTGFTTRSTKGHRDIECTYSRHRGLVHYIASILLVASSGMWLAKLAQTQPGRFMIVFNSITSGHLGAVNASFLRHA
jgi:hypothetical protein